MDPLEPDRQTLPPPCALAMVVCDAIWQDPATGKFTILGTFAGIRGKKFPLTHGQLCVYASVTDGYGKTRLRLRLIDMDEAREPVIDATQEVHFPDPQTIAEISFQANHITFPVPGEYRFQLFANDQFIIERRISVGLQEGK